MTFWPSPIKLPPSINMSWPWPSTRAEGWTCPKCGSVWSPTSPGCFKCNAQGTEARRAETTTEIGGSVHDGPVPEGDAP
jgi:uncharacterized OB-fold protein